jgi:hypothetical protein
LRCVRPDEEGLGFLIAGMALGVVGFFIETFRNYSKFIRQSSGDDCFFEFFRQASF